MVTKRIQALTGDLITIEHPSSTLDVSNQATATLSVEFGRRPYRLTSLAPTVSPSYEMVTGEYQLNGRAVRVAEVVDSGSNPVAGIDYRNLYEGDNGTLMVTTHRRHGEGIELLEALDLRDEPLGFKIGENASIRVATPPLMVWEARPLGLLNISPLTAASADALPEWEGTKVRGGELFAGHLSRSVPYLILVTPTARVDIMMLSHEADLDAAATLAADLQVTWQL